MDREWHARRCEEKVTWEYRTISSSTRSPLRRISDRGTCMTLLIDRPQYSESNFKFLSSLPAIEDCSHTDWRQLRLLARICMNVIGTQLKALCLPVLSNGTPENPTMLHLNARAVLSRCRGLHVATLLLCFQTLLTWSRMGGA